MDTKKLLDGIPDSARVIQLSQHDIALTVLIDDINRALKHYRVPGTTIPASITDLTTGCELKVALSTLPDDVQLHLLSHYVSLPKQSLQPVVIDEVTIPHPLIPAPPTTPGVDVKEEYNILKDDGEITDRDLANLKIWVAKAIVIFVLMCLTILIAAVAVVSYTAGEVDSEVVKTLAHTAEYIFKIIFEK